MGVQFSEEVHPDKSSSRKLQPDCHLAGIQCFLGHEPTRCRVEHYCIASGSNVWCPPQVQRFSLHVDICTFQLGAHDSTLSSSAQPVVELHCAAAAEKIVAVPGTTEQVTIPAMIEDTGTFKTSAGFRDPQARGWQWKPPHRHTIMVLPSTKLRLFVHGDANASFAPAPVGSLFGLSAETPARKILPFASTWLTVQRDILSQLHEPTDDSSIFRSLPTPIKVYKGPITGSVTVIFEAELPCHSPWLQVDCMGSTGTGDGSENPQSSVSITKVHDEDIKDVHAVVQEEVAAQAGAGEQEQLEAPATQAGAGGQEQLEAPATQAELQQLDEGSHGYQPPPTSPRKAR